MVLFEVGFHAKVSLSNELGKSDFPVPFSFIYGDQDWVKQVDEGSTERLLEKLGKREEMMIVSNSDHNIQMDNPDELSQLLIYKFLEQ
mmetsp:Transcript_5603/g.9648  ORF Transcript_5603/g.9648 Transcript_5603/m.9648 type:complete len:88 (+) Transcript_5603:817-1080(+)|eukprot:CAMPEP_0168610344 /NCGR_PEP_ID=MMETSP0449_2-20121227/1731_1 /TAXON_ID=1082188 /ORGANISM="Strombidium rassoulzadegani, Strain ras09" /LENGTH=87 /DNA_ID=CAMNT_0008650631 /DNA_START=725 /DNA_END=988 /DNA_ORIENTATION=+